MVFHKNTSSGEVFVDPTNHMNHDFLFILTVYMLICLQLIFLICFLKKNYLFSAALGLQCCTDFSLVVVCGLLIVVASLVAEHGL